MIGHSLGAHLSGFAGKTILSLTAGQGKLKRITGMDPALPLFSVQDPSARLDRDDAVMVDVVHTDGYRIAIGEAIGRVDFYPNGGVAPQPGCSNIFFNVFLLLQANLDGGEISRPASNFS